MLRFLPSVITEPFAQGLFGLHDNDSPTLFDSMVDVPLEALVAPSLVQYFKLNVCMLGGALDSDNIFASVDIISLTPVSSLCFDKITAAQVISNVAIIRFHRCNRSVLGEFVNELGLLR